MSQIILNERFKRAKPDARLRWLNPPPAWSLESAGLMVRPAAETDFWQRTHYGFRADSGHFLYLEVAGDFSLTTKVRLHPVHLYDQAGLMVRVGPSCWIKTSVEYETKGPSKLGAVVTNHGYSDWSLQDFPHGRKQVHLRIRREAQDFLVEWRRAEGSNWELLRVTHLHQSTGKPIQCGLYACSPNGSGFRAEFEFLRIDRNPIAPKPASP